MGILICPAFFLPIIPIALAFWCYHQCFHQQSKGKSGEKSKKISTDDISSVDSKSGFVTPPDNPSMRAHPPTIADSPARLDSILRGYDSRLSQSSKVSLED